MATNDLAGGQAASTSSNQNFKGNAREFSTSDESSKMPYVVGHDKDKKMFYIQIASSDGVEREEETAVLEYEWIRPDLVDLYHTEVPPAYRGRGVAKLLAKEALDHFSGQADIKMRLTCTYLAKYVQDNPLPRYTCCLEA